MKIRFVYSVSRGGVQLHDQEAIVEVEGPDQQGAPTPNQLLRAEWEFGAQFADPGKYLILVRVRAGGRLKRPV